MTGRVGIARDLCGLVLAVLGALGTIALATLLGSRQDWLALGLLVGSTAAIGFGVWLGRYDPDDPARVVRIERRLARADEIVMRPVVRRPPIEPEMPPAP